MSIDDMIVRDPRITKLAKQVGWSRRETIGCLVMDVWPICYDQRESVIAVDLVDLAAGTDGFASAMVESGLASWARGNRKIRIRGAQERIEYLSHRRESGRVGGLKSGESRNKNSSTASAGAEARGNPSVPVPPSASSSVPVPVPDEDPEKNSARPSDGGDRDLFGELKAKVDAATGDIGRARARKAKKPFEHTPAEAASVRLLLDKLGSHTDTQYSGTDEHARLIVGRLRDGITEWDLRCVVGYCAHPTGLGWTDKPEFAQYLRPETLFGPRTISKYLDAARSWSRKHISSPESQGATA